jgi:hypothetical protein
VPQVDSRYPTDPRETYSAGYTGGQPQQTSPPGDYTHQPATHAGSSQSHHPYATDPYGSGRGAGQEYAAPRQYQSSHAGHSTGHSSGYGSTAPRYFGLQIPEHLVFH